MRSASALASLKERFRGKDSIIDRAFERSASFRSLCAEYASCVAALEHWQGSDAGESRARAAEYEQLVGHLTREVEEYLRNAEATESERPVNDDAKP